MVRFSIMQTPLQLCSITGVWPELTTVNSMSEILVEDASLDLTKFSPVTSTEDRVKSSEFAMSINNDTSLPEILDAVNSTPDIDERPTDTSCKCTSLAFTSPALALIAVPNLVKLESVTSKLPLD